VLFPQLYEVLISVILVLISFPNRNQDKSKWKSKQIVDILQWRRREPSAHHQNKLPESHQDGGRQKNLFASLNSLLRKLLQLVLEVETRSPTDG